MTSSPKRDFTFAFFDAARTDGYVVSKRAESDPEKHNSTAGGGMFSNENENENIVNKIRELKMNERDHPDQKTKHSDLAREMLRGNAGELFMDLSGKEISKSPNDAQADSSERIQLNRLLDDYMLGTKGDRIMKQMEELISDEAADPAAKSSEKQSAPALADLIAEEELESDLFALSSMADFEKYISEN
ncbi:hypothetical protein Gpo141_00001769 [Globisporangium polare]